MQNEEKVKTGVKNEKSGNLHILTGCLCAAHTPNGGTCCGGACPVRAIAWQATVLDKPALPHWHGLLACRNWQERCEMRRQRLACSAYPAAIWHPAICLAATGSGRRTPNALHQTKATWQRSSPGLPLPPAICKNTNPAQVGRVKKWKTDKRKCAKAMQAQRPCAARTESTLRLAASMGRPFSASRQRSASRACARKCRLAPSTIQAIFCMTACTGLRNANGSCLP